MLQWQTEGACVLHRTAMNIKQGIDLKLENWTTNIYEFQVSKEPKHSNFCNYGKYDCSFCGKVVKFMLYAENHMRTVHESQIHIFTQCKTLRAQITIPVIPEYTLIFQDVLKQKQAIEYFILVDRVAKQMKENLLPGVDPRGLGT